MAVCRRNQTRRMWSATAFIGSFGVRPPRPWFLVWWLVVVPFKLMGLRNAQNSYLSNQMLMAELELWYRYCYTFRMEDYDSWPVRLPRDIEEMSKEEKLTVTNDIIDEILTKHRYAQYEISKMPASTVNPPKEFITEVVGTTDDGRVVKCKMAKPAPPPGDRDSVMSYCEQLCHWMIQLENMNDLAREADSQRAVLSAKTNIPFFYGHSTRSKYFLESLDFILKTTILGSEADHVRLLEGCFINMDGRENHEADLVMENSKRRRKDLTLSQKGVPHSK